MTKEMGYIEIFVNDYESGSKFFEKVLGWEVMHPEKGNYAHVNDIGNGIMAGITTPAEKRAIGRPIMYFTVDSIDDQLKLIESEGGRTIIPKSAIPSQGYYAVFADPSDNHFGLWEKEK